MSAVQDGHDPARPPDEHVGGGAPDADQRLRRGRTPEEARHGPEEHQEKRHQEADHAGRPLPHLDLSHLFS